MFIKFQAYSVNLDHVLHAGLHEVAPGKSWRFKIVFADDKNLAWEFTTRAAADEYLALWNKAVCPAPVDFLTK